MQLAIILCSAGSAIGGILIGIFLHYGKQTAAIWTTFVTILLITLAACLKWQLSLWNSKRKVAPPFVAQVASATVSDHGPLTIFMVAYSSVYGSTISPIYYLAYINVTNNQDIACFVTKFSIEAGKTADGPWEQLTVIPLPGRDVFYVGASNPSPKRIQMGYGTYRIGSDIQAQALRSATPLKLSVLLEAELSKQIQPHTTVSGWVALDSMLQRGLTPGVIFFRITVADAVGAKSIIIVELPRKNGVSTSVENLDIFYDLTGGIYDMSKFKVKSYSEPFS